MKPIYVLGWKTLPTCEENTADSFVTNAVNLCLMLRDSFDVKLVDIAGSYLLGIEALKWTPALARLRAEPKALVCPARGIEPFGYTVLEANVSGTPAIVTDMGAFTETVADGVNRWRCRSARDFARAIERSGEIDPARCRSWALERYSIPVVSPLSARFLASICNQP